MQVAASAEVQTESLKMVFPKTNKTLENLLQEWKEHEGKKDFSAAFTCFGQALKKDGTKKHFPKNKAEASQKDYYQLYRNCRDQGGALQAQLYYLRVQKAFLAKYLLGNNRKLDEEEYQQYKSYIKQCNENIVDLEAQLQVTEQHPWGLSANKHQEEKTAGDSNAKISAATEQKRELAATAAGNLSSPVSQQPPVASHSNGMPNQNSAATTSVPFTSEQLISILFAELAAEKQKRTRLEEQVYSLGKKVEFLESLFLKFMPTPNQSFPTSRSPVFGPTNSNPGMMSLRPQSFMPPFLPPQQQFGPTSPHTSPPRAPLSGPMSPQMPPLSNANPNDQATAQFLQRQHQHMAALASANRSNALAAASSSAASSVPASPESPVSSEASVNAETSTVASNLPMSRAS